MNGISGPVKVVSQNSMHSMVLTKWELRSGLGGILRKMHLGSGRWDQSVISDRPFVWFKVILTLLKLNKYINQSSF